MPDIYGTIHLDSIGDKTETRWVGTFKIKRVLTHGDYLAIERNYASLVPPKDRDVSEEMKLRAAAIAELAVRVIDSPPWWEGSQDGRNLLDAQPLWDLIAACNEEEKRWFEQLKNTAKTDDNNPISLGKDSNEIPVGNS